MIHEKARVLIRTENMSKYYKLGAQLEEAVKSLDTRIMQGEYIMIQGLNGNQKNAFFNLLGCLEKPDAGKYFFDYEDIALAKADMLDRIRKSKIGYLFRDFKLINRFTVNQNIEVPLQGLNISRQEKKNRILKSLRDIGIEELAESKMNALTDFNKQMVSLARAIVNDPLMIIADEPSANLNSQEEQKLMEHLSRFNEEGITILLFTSNINIKTFCSCRLISFENGMLSADKEDHGLSLLRGEGLYEDFNF